MKPDWQWHEDDDTVAQERRARLDEYGKLTWIDITFRVIFGLLVLAAIVGYSQCFMADGELHRLEWRVK